MKRMIYISKLLSECRCTFNEEAIELTFNEALVLDVVKNQNGKISKIAGILSKDRAYILRIMRSLVSKGKVQKDGNVYVITENGRETNIKALEILKEIMPVNLNIQGDL